jgi:endonuclease-3
MRQVSFAFEDVLDLRDLRNRLLGIYGPQRDEERFDPMSQLVYGMIAPRTHDEVSMAAFWRLRGSCPSWEELMDTASDVIEYAIQDVTFAEKKAVDLPRMLRMLQARHGELDIDFLAGMDEEAAMQVLTALYGVKTKIAATVLNFSTLRKRVLPVDTHLLRVGERLGFVPLGASYREAHEAYAQLIPEEWDADTLYEFHWLIKKLGQDRCHATWPDCSACPLYCLCPSRHFDPGAALTRGLTMALE